MSPLKFGTKNEAYYSRKSVAGNTNPVLSASQCPSNDETVVWDDAHPSSEDGFRNNSDNDSLPRLSTSETVISETDSNDSDTIPVRRLTGQRTVNKVTSQHMSDSAESELDIRRPSGQTGINTITTQDIFDKDDFSGFVPLSNDSSSVDSSNTTISNQSDDTRLIVMGTKNVCSTKTIVESAVLAQRRSTRRNGRKKQMAVASGSRTVSNGQTVVPIEPLCEAIVQNLQVILQVII